jgi:N utilization substance protein B
MSENNISRYEEREQAFLICFEKLFNDCSISEISEIAEESRDHIYSQFALDCANGVQENLEAIDELIKSHLSSKWKIERINKVSLSIMRLAVYEMKFLDKIPDKVSINEAVELSKKFSGEDEYKFVNGVLGAIARDIKE